MAADEYPRRAVTPLASQASIVRAHLRALNEAVIEAHNRALDEGNARAGRHLAELMVGEMRQARTELDRLQDRLVQIERDEL